MSWGSFLIGAIVGSVIFGFLGMLFGTLFSLLRIEPQISSPFKDLVKPLEQGQQLHGEFYLSTNAPPCCGGGDDDDDEGEPDPSPQFSLDDYQRN